MSVRKLDWSQLNHETFQALVSELFMGILGWLQYKPGPLQGADGGWDGLFRGVLPFARTGEHTDGLWMVDAKHYQPRSKSAYRQLLDELRVPTDPKALATRARRGKKSPIEKAVDAGADYLLIVTSAELRADHLVKLEALADGTSLKALRVMGRLPLEALVRERPWLLATYFDRGPSPLVALHDWRPRIPQRDALPFRPRPAALDRIRTALAEESGTLRVILVHGPGGSGKSRLVAELEGNVPREVLALQLGASGEAAAAVLHGLSWGEERGRYAVLIDDADREFGQRVLPIALSARTQGYDLVLVLTARTGPHKDLIYHMSALANVEDVRSVPLPELAQDERLELLRSATDGRPYDIERLEEVVLACGQNLVLLAHAAVQLKSGRPAFDFTERKNIVREIAENLVAQACSVLRGAPRELVDTLLRVLAALGDLWPEDIETLSTLVTKGRSDVAPRDVDGWLEQLRSAGVLTAVGRTLTFASDVEGDILLTEFARGGTRFLELVAEAFGDRRRFIHNIAMLALWGPDQAHMEPCRALLERGRQALETSNAWRRAERLEAIAPLARALPNEALDLAAGVLIGAEKLRVGERQRLAGAVGVIITHALLAQHGDAKTAGRCLDLAASLGDTGGTQDPALSGLLDALNPYLHGVSGPRRIIAALESRLENRSSYSARERTMLVTLLSRLLRPTVDYIRGSAVRREFRQYTRALPATGVWEELNTRAWDLWEAAILTHGDVALRAELLSEMARVGRDGSTVESPLDRRHIERRQRLLEQLEAAVPDEHDLGALAAIQKAALWHWLRLADTPPDRDGALSEPARRVLASIPRSLELNLYTCLWTPLSALDDLKRLEELPPEVRRSYGQLHDSLVVATHQRVATAVLQRATTPDELVSLFRVVGDSAAPFNGFVPPVAKLLVRDGYRLVDVIMRDPARRQALPPGLAAMLERVWVELAPDGLEWLVGRIGDLGECSAGDAFQVAMAAIMEAHRGNTDQAVTVLREIAGHGDPDVRRQLAELVQYTEALTPDTRMELLAALIRGAPGQSVVKSLAQSLEWGTELLVGADRRPIRESLLATASEAPQLADGLFIRLLAWTCHGDFATFLDALDTLILAAGPESASLGGSLSEKALCGFKVDEAALGALFARIEAHAQAGHLPTAVVPALRQSLLSSLPDASDALLDRLLRAEPLNLDACLEVLTAAVYPSRFAALASPWVTLLRRAGREISDERLEPLVEAFVGASRVQEFSSQGDEMPPALIQRDILLTELTRQLAADDAVALRALDLARRELEKGRTEWRDRQAERRASKDRPQR